MRLAAAMAGLLEACAACEALLDAAGWGGETPDAASAGSALDARGLVVPIEGARNAWAQQHAAESDLRATIRQWQQHAVATAAGQPAAVQEAADRRYEALRPALFDSEDDQARALDAWQRVELAYRTLADEHLRRLFETAGGEGIAGQWQQFCAWQEGAVRAAAAFLRARTLVRTGVEPGPRTGPKVARIQAATSGKGARGGNDCR